MQRATTAGLNACATRRRANSALDTGLASANNYYGQALSPYLRVCPASSAPARMLITTRQASTGEAGLNRATQTFTSLPGYQQGIDMAVNLNDRQAASRGMLASGNTIADTTKLATDYASQKYGDYLSSLAPNLSRATSAATGQAGVLTEQAANASNVAGQKSSVRLEHSDEALAMRMQMPIWLPTTPRATSGMP